MITEIRSGSEFTNLIHGKELVFADFYATWCEPCKWLDPILLEIQTALPDLRIIKIDTDKHLAITQQYGLRSVPVLMIFREGKVMWKMNGFLTASELLTKIREISRET